MFRRRKNKNTLPETPSLREQHIGSLALPQTAEVSPDTERALPAGPSKEELAERSQGYEVTLKRLYRDYIAAAAAEGKDKEQIQASLIEGWNTNTLPRLVLGFGGRGSGYGLTVLHGEIPSNMFELFHDNEEEDLGVVLPGEISAARLTLEHPMDTIPTAPNPDAPSAFYIETFWLPQVPDKRQGWDEVGSHLDQVEALMQAVNPES